MARPPKKGLEYFPKDVDYYGDDKIISLLIEYGPLGQTVYDIIITLIYKQGYYIEMPLDRLVLLIVRIIGNKWVKRDAVTQVIHYCADIGLFDDVLLRQNVITSVAVQRRYNEVTARNKVNKDKYWLLETEQPLESASQNSVSVAETSVNVTETPVSNAEMQQIKVNKIKENKRECVTHTHGRFGNVNLTDDQYSELVNTYGDNADKLIDKLDRWLENHPDVNKPNHFAELLTWADGDKIPKVNSPDAYSQLKTPRRRRKK